MNNAGSGAWWYLVVAAGILLAIVAMQLTPNARLRRRRRKSHSHIVSKGRRPMVRFSVRPPKDPKREKKR